MKKILCGLLAAVLMMTAAGAALAGAGDVTLFAGYEQDYTMSYLSDVVVLGTKVYIFLMGTPPEVQIYDTETGETKTWTLPENLSGYDSVETVEENGELLTCLKEIACWFPANGEIYALMNYSYTGNEVARVDGGHVRKLVLGEDGTASLEEEDTLRLDWSEMTETSGMWVSSRHVAGSAAVGDRLYLSCYDNSSDTLLDVFDLKTGEHVESETVSASEIAASGDGRLLMARYDWNGDGELVIETMNPEDGTRQETARFSTDNGTVGAVAVGEDGTLYFTRNGEIFAAPEGDVSRAEAVNDSPSIRGDTFGKLVPDGRLLMWDYSSVFLRNTDASKRSAVTLRVRPLSGFYSLDKGVMAYTADHGDVAVIREDYGDESMLLQEMMNRESRVDVYVLGRESSAFSAVYDRGFTADLSGYAGLQAETEKIYPFIREAVEKDGKLVAVPLRLDGDSLGYSPSVLEKLGMTEEDLPKSWNQLFTFLEEMSARLENTEFCVLDRFYAQEDIRTMLLKQYLSQYAAARDGGKLNTAEARDTLEKIRNIDFDALGIMTSEELALYEERGDFGNYKESLLLCYANAVGFSEYSAAMPLSLTDGEDPMIPVNLTIGFVNPFSEHPQEAAELLAAMYANSELTTRYVFDPNLNEAMHYPDHEETRKSLQKWLDNAKENLEKAEDEEDRENWQASVDSYQEYLDDWENRDWMVSPGGISRYRNNAQYMKVATWDYLTALYAAESGTQIDEMTSGFAAGTVGAAELLDFIDRKVQMMRMEGY